MAICRIVSKFAPKIERNQMNKLIKTVCALFTAVLLLASCMKSDDSSNSTLYSDTAITNFYFGTLNRYHHTTSSTGADSIYKTTFDGDDYKFSIDQVNHRIFNTYSLPMGTDVKHMVTYITTLNNATPYLLSETGDTLFFYSSTDSLDFSRPRKIEVYASNGVNHTTYTVEVNVHKEDSEQFIWITHNDSREIYDLDKMKATIINGQLFVYGNKDEKTLGYVTKDGNSWTALAELDDKNAYSNILNFNNSLFTIANGALIKSDNGTSWEVVNAAVDVTKLIAASYNELFGLTSDGKMMVSDDNGVTWEEDLTDTDTGMLPTTETAYVCYPANMTYYADNILIAGTSAGVADISSVWRKIVEYDLQGDEKWVYMSRMDNNLFALPQMENLVMMDYDDGILAWGIKDGAYTPIYQSRDNGLIWKKSSSYKLPVFFSEDAIFPFCAATNGKEIWLIGGNGQVWQGHLNRLSWE